MLTPSSILLFHHFFFCLFYELLWIRDTLHSHLLSDLKNLSASLLFLQLYLEVCIVYPRSWNLGKFFAINLVNSSHSFQLVKVFFHLYVGFEHFFFWKYTNCSSISLSCFLEIIASKTKVSIEDP